MHITKKSDVGGHKNTHRVVRCRSSAKSPSSIIDMLLNRKSLPGKTTQMKICCWTSGELSSLMKRMRQGRDDLWQIQQAVRARQTICTCKPNKSHMQRRKVARAMQTSHTCKADKCMLASWFKAWFKVILIFINCKTRLHPFHRGGIFRVKNQSFQPHFPVWTAPYQVGAWPLPWPMAWPRFAKFGFWAGVIWPWLGPLSFIQSFSSPTINCLNFNVLAQPGKWWC